MLNIKHLLLFVILCFSIKIRAQNSEKGIKWILELSLEQVKAKALKENKYIFLDCFTTWCGPCKQMDNLIYNNDSVGSFFNDHFLSVKVQMDKTDNDNEQVKRWYEDVDTLKKKYYVDMYPTYIFLSPQGIVLHKDVGFKNTQNFISLGSLAMQPGRKYDDPNKDYEILLARYKQGDIAYDRLPYMVRCTDANRDMDLWRQLIKVHLDYVCKLPPNLRYTQENIKFWASLPLNTGSRLFNFFYVDGNLIDNVMARKGFSRNVIDIAIMNEIIRPFLVEQAAGSGVTMTGGYLTTVSPTGKTAKLQEADWRKLENMLTKKFNTDCARRNVLAAKVEWYERHENKAASARYFLFMINKYPPDLTVDLKSTVLSAINNRAYDAFLFSTDKKILEGYLPWMKKVLVIFAEYIDAGLIDTYACLLYKTGRSEDAIKWMEKAVALVPVHTVKNSFDVKLEEMKRGKRLSEAVVWK
ncbi:hypothetical protein A4H97_22915 [Niastella yeongjuensis]|uniref:Thioredoxin-like fold domain-containing protein n=1 Tax=Niastella yeongjuensis TaxID=354355 RepID=A0A1V9F7W9_9BACT|nr:thioredoxin fold domain-containing protein [Niastella yeongjuensis]OQP54337.1 hypothetical protein A4H97_22915 [Niastella yeongjuensis]SEP29961.1 Thioredoxin-like [Niastella yeongjuensis]